MNTKELKAIHDKCIGILEMIDSFHHRKTSVKETYISMNRMFPTWDNSRYINQLEIIDKSIERLEAYYQKQVNKMVSHR